MFWTLPLSYDDDHHHPHNHHHHHDHHIIIMIIIIELGGFTLVSWGRSM